MAEIVGNIQEKVQEEGSFCGISDVINDCFRVKRLLEKGEVI